MAIRDDQLPTTNAPVDGARLMLVDELTGATPTTKLGPTVIGDQVEISGHPVGSAQFTCTPLNGWTDTGTIIFREGSIVTLMVKALDSSAATSALAYQIPEGYRPPYFDLGRGILFRTNMATLRSHYLDGSFQFGVSAYGANDILYGNPTWPTDDPWPT